jgi:DNA-binding LacI/PurR family transcriptional regulator
LPDIKVKLQLCPTDVCDRVDNYHLEGQSVANQIRLLHHLLSAYWLLNPPHTLNIEPSDQPYLAIICRGHRGADLRSTKCACYQNAGEQLRMGVIAGLLRLADALDFYSNRAPAEVLDSKAREFLDNPIALRHWLKHYFVNGPYITVNDQVGNRILECQLVVAVPADEKIGNKSYLEFLQPLFDEHIREANQTDLDIQQYPPSFTSALAIVEIRAALRPEPRFGDQHKLPPRILSEITSAKSTDISAFLKKTQSNDNRSKKPDKPAAENKPRQSRSTTGPFLNRILVLAPLFGASSIYYSNLLNAIIQSASRYGYELSIQPIEDVKQKRTLREYAPNLIDLSGVIAITSQVESSAWLAECRDAHLPVVLIHDNIEESKLMNTTVVSYLWPNLEGLSDLVSHLIHDHQRKNICVVMISARGHRIRQKKLDIIRDTIIQAGLTLEREHIFHVREYTHKEGRDITGEILDANPTVDAIICLADVTAVGILRALKEHNRDDVMVTGFDNIDLAKHFDLTSVDQQLEATGERALMDLHTAIKNRGAVVFDKPTYIPTTLVKRASCCAPERSRFRQRNPVQRFAIYYVIEDTRILDMIRNVHRKIYLSPNRTDNTNELIGNAPLFPPHVTIKGIFQIDPGYPLQEFLEELTKIVMPIKRFRVTVKEVQPYPEKSISLGFDEDSEQEMRTLQECILPVINRFRNHNVIEPEFRSALASDADSRAHDNTRKYGEPRIGDLFNPHITIVAGVKDGADRTKIEEYINISELAGIELEVNKISVLYETMLGSSWEILREIPLS